MTISLISLPFSSPWNWFGKWGTNVKFSPAALFHVHFLQRKISESSIRGGGGRGLAGEFWSGRFSRGSGLSIRPMWLCSFKQVCREVSLHAWLVKNCIDKSFFFSSRLKGYQENELLLSHTFFLCQFLVQAFGQCHNRTGRES